jgi:hypothetical protein
VGRWRRGRGWRSGRRVLRINRRRNQYKYRKQAIHPHRTPSWQFQQTRFVLTRLYTNLSSQPRKSVNFTNFDVCQGDGIARVSKRQSTCPVREAALREPVAPRWCMFPLSLRPGPRRAGTEAGCPGFPVPHETSGCPVLRALGSCEGWDSMVCPVCFWHYNEAPCLIISGP